MKTRFNSLGLVLLVAVLAGESSFPASASEDPRPLNLSLPREVLSAPAGIFHQQGAGNALPSLGERDGSPQPLLRYGIGYEARQRGMARGGAGGFDAGSGAPSGSGAGMGRGGRGGMGRGR